MKPIVVGIILVVAFSAADTCWAYLIGDVSVSPMNPTSATPTNLIVDMITPSTAAFLTQPTVTSLNGNHFSVDVFLGSGALTALDSLTEIVPLGALRNGVYGYTVTLHPMIDIPFGREMRVVSGEFTVVPEPSAWLLGYVASLIWPIRRTQLRKTLTGR